MMPKNTNESDCWVISDGAAGNERQALALAQALGRDPRVIRIALGEPWAMLAPRMTWGARHAIAVQTGAPLAPPWPSIAIGCGRRAALATRLLRRWSNGRTFCVQILDPRIDSRAFDLVIAPEHDRVRGQNVLHTIGALNDIDRDWIASARRNFSAFEALPAPRVAVLIGGSTRAQRLDKSYFDALIEHLAARQALDHGSFLVSVSRRTPSALTAWLRERFAPFPGIFFDGAGAENPYAGLLAWADCLVVTPDSVNMLSEAAATGKPLYTFAPRPIAGKLARFHAQMSASGYLRRLDDVAPRIQLEPLAETEAIAELVSERWDAHRASILQSA